MISTSKWLAWSRIPAGRLLLRPLLRLFIRGRRALRNSELGVIAVAALIGLPVGVLVAGLHNLVNALHTVIFNLPPGVRLSAEVHAASWRTALVPFVGGALLGATRYFIRRDRPSDIVDPIEANALRGGEMSFKDSLRLLVSTLTSNASGASVGMEAGYTQMGGAIFSACGRFFRLRREDRRIFVTAGAAAAISAAFDAPLAGAFYGFELVQGAYTMRGLAPVALASLMGAWMTRLFGAKGALFRLTPGTVHVAPWVYPGGLALGLGAALIGILTMRSASVIEDVLRRAEVPTWIRPGFAGLILGIIAMGSPQVLGSGQGAIQFHIENEWPAAALVILLIAKIAASAICLGCGFRGGLFSTSLMIGCVYGAAASGMLVAAAPWLEPQGEMLRLMGMAAMGASIIGAPLTMAFLVLESTGDLTLAIAVLSAVLVSSTITRIKFGYSFATWRFHLRGLTLRGAYDVGWVRDITVGRLMRRDPRLVREEETLATLAAAIRPGMALRVFAVDGEGHYIGAIDSSILHDPEVADAGQTIIAADLATGKENFLTPNEDVQEALKKFDSLRLEVLPVVNTAKERKVVGYLTEALALRRYAEELERRRSDDLGVPTAAE